MWGSRPITEESQDGGGKPLKSDPKSQKHRNTQNFSFNSYVNNQKFSITVGGHPLPPARASHAGNIEKVYKIYEFCASVVFHGLFSSDKIVFKNIEWWSQSWSFSGSITTPCFDFSVERVARATGSVEIARNRNSFLAKVQDKLSYAPMSSKDVVASDVTFRNTTLDQRFDSIQSGICWFTRCVVTNDRNTFESFSWEYRIDDHCTRPTDRFRVVTDAMGTGKCPSSSFVDVAIFTNQKGVANIGPSYNRHITEFV